MKKEKIASIIIPITLILVSSYLVNYILCLGWEFYQKLSIIVVLLSIIISGGWKMLSKIFKFYDKHPMLRVDSIKVGGIGDHSPSVYRLSLENYRDVDCKSNEVTFLLKNNLCEVDKIEPYGGGDLFTKGVRRGSWDRVIPCLDSAKEGDIAIARVFTRSVNDEMCFCSCSSFIFRNGNWYRHDGFANTTQPYVFTFTPHRKCPFDRNELINAMKVFCKRKDKLR